jgi:hypothetical protein
MSLITRLCDASPVGPRFPDGLDQPPGLWFDLSDRINGLSGLHPGNIVELRLNAGSIMRDCSRLKLWAPSTCRCQGRS